MSTGRGRLALAASSLLHLAVVSAVVVASAAPASVEGPSRFGDRDHTWFGVQQLRGNQGVRPPGWDPLFHVLTAPDGVKVRLTSPTGETAVGLGWLSHSRGLWLAVDLANAHAGETLQAWVTDGDVPPSPLATMEIGADGSGRIVAVWEDNPQVRPDRAMTLILTSTRGIWPFRRSGVFLRGEE